VGFQRHFIVSNAGEPNNGETEQALLGNIYFD
jgi:hypothetical protein